MLKYKGYIAHAEYDDEAEIFHGQVINTKDVITFQSEHAKELKQEMITSVDAHLDFCAAMGKTPSKLFSGEFVIRTSPETHGLINCAAKTQGMSLNKWASRALEMAAREVTHEFR